MRFEAVIFLLTFLNVASGLRVLVTSLGISGSQNLVMYRLADLVASKGHDVTVLKAEIFPEAKVPALKYAKEVVYKLIEDEHVLAEVRGHLSQVPWHTSSSQPMPFKQMKAIFSHVISGCESMLKNKKVMAELSSGFDVAILHMMDFCPMGPLHRQSVPMILFSTAFLMDPLAYFSGVPFPSSYVPAAPHAVRRNMSFFERTKNTVMSPTMLGLMQTLFLPQYDAIFRDHFSEKPLPSLLEILSETVAYFVNSDPFMDFIRPVQNNIVYVGGLTMQTPEPLSEDWNKRISDAPSKDLILFSLGSVCDTKAMPKQWKLAFLNAFREFKDYTFIWRLEGEFTEAESVPNVIISTWLPQKDLIGLPSVKALITHGGYNSLSEAFYSGVPVVVLPLFGDQYANVQRVLSLGIASVIDKTNITKENVITALKTLLNDPKVQSRSDRFSEMVQNQAKSPGDLALHWIEHAAKAKLPTSKKMLPHSTRLSFLSYYSIDVITFLGAILVLGLYILFSLVHDSFRQVFGWGKWYRGPPKRSKAN